MGDVLSGVFGGGQSGSQKQTVDPITANMNKIKQDQMMTILGYGGAGGSQPTTSGQFTQPGGGTGAYTPDSRVDQLLGYGFGGQQVDNPFTLQQYMQMGSGLGTDYSGQNWQNNAALLNQGLTGIGDNTAAGMANVQGNTTANLANIQGNTDTALQQSGTRFQDAYKQAYNAGLDTSSNYISQIARPQINQAMALQGLEGGGAVPDAIARATAGISTPYLQSLLPMVQQYLQEQGGIQGQNQQLQAAALQGNQQLQAGIQQAGQQQQAGLYGTEMPLQAQSQLGAQQLQQGTLGNFVQSIPQAATQLGMLPVQQQGAKAQIASTLFPLADYGRNLQQQDLERRQGLMQTAMTGIPYTPQTSTQQSTSQKPLFNFFGMG